MYRLSSRIYWVSLAHAQILQIGPRRPKYTLDSDVIRILNHEFPAVLLFFPNMYLNVRSSFSLDFIYCACNS